MSSVRFVLFSFSLPQKFQGNTSILNGINGDIDVAVHINHTLSEEIADEMENLSSNLVRSELSIKPVEEWLVKNTLWPINDKPTNSNILCTTIDSVSNSDTISCNSENYTCVGEPEYCNLTESEYLEMLHDYIFPTPGEWVLIGFHAAVFLVGLVSLIC